MATVKIPRFLLPRSPLLSDSFSKFLESETITIRRQCLQRGYASGKAAASKPKMLDKPTRFNPPSHPARLNKVPPRQYPGPPLPFREQEAQKTRNYPHTMPRPGTRMHWFLTNRSIHVWITMGTLCSVALFTFTKDFRQNTPFRDMLPEGKSFFSHPIKFCLQIIEVFRLNIAHTSAETAERRKRKVDDVQKRAQYRKAHGLDKNEGWGGWTAKGDEENASPVAKIDGAIGEAGSEQAIGSTGSVTSAEAAEDDGTYVDWEGKRRRVKKWFGIW